MAGNPQKGVGAGFGRIGRTAGALLAALILFPACSSDGPNAPAERTVPHETAWGIYALDPASGDIDLVYASDSEISGLRLNEAGDRFVFDKKIGGTGDDAREICTVAVDGTDFRRVTENAYWDTYPCWSPDGETIAFLSWRDATLDIYTIGANGAGESMLYGSGFHDADIDWRGEKIAFTRESLIWVMNEDGTGAHPVTDNPDAGTPSDANLPFGDYDPRISPDLSHILFERLDDDQSPHGNYNIYKVAMDGSGETRLTETGYSQGFATWSPVGERVAFLVAAIGEVGQYDLYMMNADGSGARNVTPDYVPDDFLCHAPVFSTGGGALYFVGQWWEG